MKNRLMLLLVLVGLLMMLAVPSGFVQKVRAAAGDELPCDPSPGMLRMCQIRGGTFNFATCQCEFPE